MTRCRTESYVGSLAQGNLVYLADGTGSVELRPGRYEVYGSRGPEYGVQKKKVTVKAGKTKRLKFVLDKLLVTPDALAGDFHIHSARSLDSSAGLPGARRELRGRGRRGDGQHRPRLPPRLRARDRGAEPRAAS